MISSRAHPLHPPGRPKGGPKVVPKGGPKGGRAPRPAAASRPQDQGPRLLQSLSHLKRCSNRQLLCAEGNKCDKFSSWIACSCCWPDFFFIFIIIINFVSCEGQHRTDTRLGRKELTHTPPSCYQRHCRELRGGSLIESRELALLF